MVRRPPARSRQQDGTRLAIVLTEMKKNWKSFSIHSDFPMRRYQQLNKSTPSLPATKQKDGRNNHSLKVKGSTTRAWIQTVRSMYVRIKRLTGVVAARCDEIIQSSIIGSGNTTAVASSPSDISSRIIRPIMQSKCFSAFAIARTLSSGLCTQAIGYSVARNHFASSSSFSNCHRERLFWRLVRRFTWQWYTCSYRTHKSRTKSLAAFGSSKEKLYCTHSSPSVSLRPL